MAPFQEAIKLELSRSEGKVKIYAGNADPQWTVGVVPNGGYIVALIVKAVMLSQANTDQPDPIHLAAHFLKSGSVGPYEIHVRTLKTGRTFTNIIADFVQSGSVRVMSHLIFGTNADNSVQSPHLNLRPPSSYARRIPFYSHPSISKTVGTTAKQKGHWNYWPNYRMTLDPGTITKNKPDAPNRANSSTIGGDGLEWASWYQWVDEGDTIDAPSLAYLTDMFDNLVWLMPPSEHKGYADSWAPTMFLQVDFKTPIPKRSEYHSDRTVGIYATSKFLDDGRWNGWVEVWTAPCNLGEGEDKGDWREKQVCLAVGTSTCYTLPMDVNWAKESKL